MPRRLVALTVTAVALAAAMLLGTGCGKGAGRATPTTSAISPSWSPSSPLVDPSAQAICEDLQRNILDTDAKAFGAELGKMVAARISGNVAAQDAAQQAAIAKLKEIATKVRASAASATDPRLKNALTETADNLEKLAADTGSFTSITSLDQVGQATKRFVESFNEIGKYCALPSPRG
jgi:hypothetical protein